MKKPWLKDWPWQTVVTINEGLRKEKHIPDKGASRRFEVARRLWESARRNSLTFGQTLALCRKCHKLAPFSFYNGNTFAAIGRTMVQQIVRKAPPTKAHAIRSVVGHYIAGTIGPRELKKALEDCNIETSRLKRINGARDRS